MNLLEKHLASLTTNCNKCSLEKIKSEVPQAAFVCANSYRETTSSLGPGPISDTIRVATLCRKRGIPVFSLFDCTAQTFVNYAIKLLRDVYEYILIYFSGHGGQMPDLDGDEDDKMDELYVFKDGYVVDDTLFKLLQLHKNPKSQCVLLSDCCHSGTIWDLDRKDPPARCLSMAAAQDKQTAAQAVKKGREFGYFTEILFDELDKNISATPKQLKEAIDTQLKAKKITQIVTLQSTSPGLLDLPLLPQGDESNLQQKKKLQTFQDVEIPPHGMKKSELRIWYEQRMKKTSE